MGTVYVCFVCDNNYAMPTAVAIASLRYNKSEDRAYCVYVLGDNLTKANADILTGLETENFRVIVKACGENPDFKKLAKRNLHVTTSSLYKFMLPDLFEELDKILYLDGDIVANKDVASLYDHELQDCYAAVVKDFNVQTYDTPQTVKLGVAHAFYFNSGVMLLNLKKMREDDIPRKLIEYRKKEKNFFMDQDALNVVFRENVRYLPFIYNELTTLLMYYDINVLNIYYDLHAKSEEEVFRDAFIIHFASPKKPWLCEKVLGTELWDRYYEIAFNEKFKDSRSTAELESVEYVQKNKSQWGITRPLVISLTTIKKRIHVVREVIAILLCQTVEVDKVWLYLGEEDFPGKEKDLPDNLLDLVTFSAGKFEICWRKDIGPHTKYFYAMKEHGDSIIITVDDDIRYQVNMVEELLDSYREYPFAIIARRAHLIKFDESGNLLPYRQWKGSYSGMGEVSLALFATGVGGVLYPPHCMPQELFNEAAIRRLCLFQDDIWVKVMQVISNTPVALAAKSCKLNFVDGTQEDGLCNTNVTQGINDITIKKIMDAYDHFVSENDSLMDRIKYAAVNFTTTRKKDYEELYEKSRKEINQLKGSRTYKCGALVVWLPKKVRNGIRCYREHGLVYTLHRIQQKTSHLLHGNS